MDKKMPKVLFFGMIKPTKGLDVLLKAMQKINAQVIVAGRVRKQSMSDYTEAFSDLKKQGKLVTDINYITNEKRDLYFKSADVIVLPYTKIYQSGVLLMAMSYGIPVIASDLQPNLELASEIDCMEFFKVGDHLMLERVMSSLLANRDRRDVLRKNGFSVLESSHNWNKIANSFKQIICR
ncbi:MAG: glycosyltransferase family 4 protein [Bacteroidetes bacterium]|nr:glycosyltransferase family 4 protein [Bacteroidota bacterium]